MTSDRLFVITARLLDHAPAEKANGSPFVVVTSRQALAFVKALHAKGFPIRRLTFEREGEAMWTVGMRLEMYDEKK